MNIARSKINSDCGLTYKSQDIFIENYVYLKIARGLKTLAVSPISVDIESKIKLQKTTLLSRFSQTIYYLRFRHGCNRLVQFVLYSLLMNFAKNIFVIFKILSMLSLLKTRFVTSLTQRMFDFIRIIHNEYITYKKICFP